MNDILLSLNPKHNCYQAKYKSKPGAKYIYFEIIILPQLCIESGNLLY